jgi:hypothetical protein
MKVQNLKFRHCQSVVAHIIGKHLEYSATSPRGAKDFLQWGHLKCSPRVFWRLYTLKYKSVIMETNNIQNVLKSVAG